MQTSVRDARPVNSGLALAVIVTTQLMVVLDATVVNIALTPIHRDLHFSAASLSWVVNAYTLTFGGLLLLGGRAGDVFGRRRLLIAGLAVFTIASALGGLATSPAWLVAARAVQGVGAAMAAPSTLALITATFSEGGARNRALGVFTAVSAGGGSLGLILGGALTALASWRWVLFINVPIGLAIIVLAPRYVKEPERNPAGLDLRGAVLSTTGLAALIYGFIRIGEHGVSAVTTAACFAAAGTLLGAFILLEMRTAQPLMPLHLFADRTRAGGFADMLLLPAAMFGMFFFIGQFFEGSLHYSAIQAGFAFLPLTGLIFTMSRITPRLVARTGPRPLLITGLALITLGLIWLSQVPAHPSYLTGLFGPLLLFGLGAGTCFLPLTVTILNGVAPADAGATSGMLQTMQQVGGSLGVAVLVSVASSHGQSGALLTAAGFTGVGLLVALAVGARRPSAAPAVAMDV